LQLLQIFIFKISAAGTDFKITGLLPAAAKFAVKYRLSRWNTGHLAILLASCKKAPAHGPAGRAVQVCVRRKGSIQ